MSFRLNKNIGTLDQVLRLGISGVMIYFGLIHTGIIADSFCAHLVGVFGIMNAIVALKIDTSFVIDMAQDENNAAIVRAVIDLGHNMGLEVIAEGIENTASLDTLSQLGCDTAQGYHIAKPMPAQKFAQWLKDSPWEVERTVIALHSDEPHSAAATA